MAGPGVRLNGRGRRWWGLATEGALVVRGRDLVTWLRRNSRRPGPPTRHREEEDRANNSRFHFRSGVFPSSLYTIKAGRKFILREETGPETPQSGEGGSTPGPLVFVFNQHNSANFRVFLGMSMMSILSIF